MKDERKIRSTYANRDNALLDLGAMGYREIYNVAGVTTYYAKGMESRCSATLTTDGADWILTRDLV